MWIALVERRIDLVRAMTGEELAQVPVEDLPSDLHEHGCPRCGPVNVLASEGDCRRSEVAWHCEHIGLHVVLRVGDSGPRRRVAPLTEAVDVTLPQTMPVSSGPNASTWEKRQIVPPPIVLQVEP
jgi:predicted RNA-binding Zn-ribbon protein involved in translation (DUF1610 family)